MTAICQGGSATLVWQDHDLTAIFPDASMKMMNKGVCCPDKCVLNVRTGPRSHTRRV